MRYQQEPLDYKGYQLSVSVQDIVTEMFPYFGEPPTEKFGKEGIKEKIDGERGRGVEGREDRGGKPWSGDVNRNGAHMFECLRSGIRRYGLL